MHGYRADLGLRVFTGQALGRQRTGTAMGGMRSAMLVKLWKYLQLRFDTRLAYNPLLNYKM